MLLELNLAHMIESYQLPQIYQIDIDLKYKQLQNIQINDKLDEFKNIELKSIQTDNATFEEKENLIRIFNCEKDSFFMKYETNLKKQFEEKFGSQKKMKQFSKELIWGEHKNEQYLAKKLDDDTLKQIQESLSIFKRYSKFALKNKRMIIQGRQLYSSVSIEQLFNLILLNENSIESVVFKDNRKIPSRVFKIVLKKISKLSNLKELAFINSVVEEQNIIHLRYLIKKLKIQYLILYKSYFLSSEMDFLLNRQNEEPVFQLNQFRYSLIDINHKKNYEFSQYSFCLEDVQSKPQDQIMMQEELFLKQQSFPHNIKNVIANYQSKKVAIIQKESIDKIPLNYFKYLHNTRADSRELKQIQGDLIRILEDQFFQDDINEINYSLIYKLILFVQENELQQKFKESLQSCKSYKILKQKYCLDALKKQAFNNITQLQIRYSYLHGFTNIKDNIDYLITLEKSDLYNIIYKENCLFFDQHYNSDKRDQLKLQLYIYDLKCLNFYCKLFMFINSSYFRENSIEQIIDLVASDLILDNLIVNFGVMERLKDDFGKQVFYGIIKKIKNVKSFAWYDKFTDEQSTIEIDNTELEEFRINLSENRDINKFYQAIHSAFNLTKMVIHNLDFSKKGFDQLDRSIFPPFLSHLEIETKFVESAQYINQLFQCFPNLSSITLIFKEIQASIMKEISFPYFLKEIHLFLNQQQNINQILVKIGLQTFFQLESLSLSGFSMLGRLPQQYSKYLQTDTLPGFENLKRFYLNCKIEDENYVNLVLNNIKVIDQSQQNHHYLHQTQQKLQKNIQTEIDFNYNQSCYNGLKCLSLIESNMSETMLANLNLAQQKHSLKLLNLSRNRKIENFSFLNQIFEICINLKTLNLSYCNINEENFKNVKMELTPNSLKKIILNGNFQLHNIDQIINKISNKCDLKVLHLRDCNINNKRINNMQLQKIAKSIKSLDLCANSDLTDFTFLEDFYKYNSKLESIYLPRGIDTTKINFEYLRKNLKVLDIDKTAPVKLKSDHFKSYLHQKLGYSFNYLNYQNKYCVKKSDQIIDYHDVFQFANITDQIQINLNEIFDPKHFEPSFSFDKFEKLKSSNSNMINYSSDVEFSKHVHPFYFYPFFQEHIQNSQSSQIICQDMEDNEKRKSLSDDTKKYSPYIQIQNQNSEYNNNQRLISIQESQITNFNDRSQLSSYFVAEQNVYQDLEFIVQNFFNEQAFLEDQPSIGQQFYKQKITIKNQLRNIDFLSHLIEKMQILQKIDFSGSNLFFDKLQQNQIKSPLLFLTDLIFSGLRCSNSDNQILIIDQLLKNAPNLLKLNISNTNMSTERSCDFNLINQSLEFLDISYNRFPSLDKFRCPSLEAFKISYQRNFYDLDLDDLLQKIPNNVGEVILTNIQNQMNVLMIEKQDQCQSDIMLEYGGINNKQEEIDDENALIQFTLETDYDLNTKRSLKESQSFYAIKKKMFYIFNEQKIEKKWLLNSVQGKIKELDISGNFDLNQTNIECINQLKHNSNLYVFKANNTNLTDQLVNFSKNPHLNQIDILNPIFDKNPLFVLNTLNLLQTNCDLFDFISKYHRQVKTLQYDINQFYTSCNSIRNYKLSANMEKSYINFLSKTLKSEQDKQIFKSLSIRMRDVKEEKQFNSYQQLLIFFLQSENQMIYPQFKNSFFIMSPNFISQQILRIQKNDLNEKSNSYSNFIDNFSLFLIEHCILQDKTKYIFAYDKYFYQEYPDFYYQDLDSNTNSIQFLFKLQKQMLELNIKQAFLPIRLVCSQETLQKLNISELDLLQCLTMIPANKIKLTNLSIQFVKSWYAINYYSPLTTQTNIEIHFSHFENSSVANFISNYFYQLFINSYDSKQLKERFKVKLSKLCYNIFQIFNLEPQKYKFDHSVIQLEQLFDKKQKSFKPIMLLIYIIYIAVCVIGIFLVSQYNNINCGQGISWYSYITYAFFGVFTLIYEAYIFNIQLKYVSHLIPELKTNCKRNFPHKMINQVKQFIIDISWLNQWYMNYAISFIFSQLSRFNFFSNVAYLYSTYTCQKYLQFSISIFAISIIALVEIPFLMPKLFNVRRTTKLITQNIDELYEICNAAKFQAVSDVFATVSPNNSFVYKNKMFNLRIVNNFLRIIFHDIPFIIIQAYEIINSNSSHRQILINLLTSSLMLAISLSKFLSITPSFVSQEDFNILNQYKKKHTLPRYKGKLSKYESEFLQYNHIELLKCIQSQSYYSEYLKKQGLQENSKQFKDQMNFAQSLKRFQHNIDELNKIFGSNANISQLQQQKSIYQTQLSFSNYLFKEQRSIIESSNNILFKK
ncbi:transmembrane protein, putative (macronuclear) [Tetrahymena thermophila SB210]|uniref:Transmembrane protein, putative n=1 Tax=Tetrahymena thermophila (strain SB210) TaxID=312017 RepID=I7LUM5_TETTS|nr:transmembrane protein, putative [Tetrahymena thermophila SB210]EAR94969.2 transmembrane protein, putative [Tetrahymena thermophila SB210]|eukprot:XP_001015214.2 transmembrane protein, putative [Tetrahymena thermophila SB210]